ncbi:MAG: hypothetical protein P4L22_00820 [Candidatus Babeliales bacterium]|nr:hypothetical protein [Candidatus Babeliales bacterium]
MKKLVLSLVCCLFVAQLSAQSFFEKHHKPILCTTIGVSVFIIGYLLRTKKDLKNKNFDLKREIWRKKESSMKDIGINTDNSDSSKNVSKEEKYIYPKALKTSKMKDTKAEEFEFYS